MTNPTQAMKSKWDHVKNSMRPLPEPRHTGPYPTANGDKVKFGIVGSKTDGLTGVVRLMVGGNNPKFPTSGMAHITMDDGSSERYIPIKYLVKIG
jgi:hypothetical protein